MPFSRMISKTFFIFTMFAMFSVLNGCAAKNILIVDQHGNGDYTSIRAAVSDWEKGKKLIINPGVYDEQLILKTWMKIDGFEGVPEIQRSSISKDKHKVVIAFSGDGPSVVGRDVSEVRLSNLIIKKFNKKSKAVIQLRGTDIEIDNCTISGGMKAGIDAARFGNLVIRNSLIENNNQAGIVLHNQARADIRTSTIRNNKRGIVVEKFPAGIPKNRTIYRDEAKDIEVLIKENSISDNSIVGIFLTKGAMVEIISNSFISNATEAIKGEGKNRTVNLDMAAVSVTNQSNVKMLSNSISFSDMGLVFQESAGGVAIENTFLNNENYGIVVTGYGKPEIIGNIIKDNKGSGIMLRTSTEAIVQDNQIIKNALQGIEIVDGARPLIEGNWIIQNGSAGIYAYKNAKPSIRRNILVDNAKAGLLISSGSKVEAFYNTFYKNRNIGVWFKERGQGVFANNVIVGSETALSLMKNSDYQPTVLNNCLWNNKIDYAGFLEKPTGNFNADPLFKNAKKLDFTPLADSPLISESRGKRVVVGAIDPFAID